MKIDVTADINYFVAVMHIILFKRANFLLLNFIIVQHTFEVGVSRSIAVT